MSEWIYCKDTPCDENQAILNRLSLIEEKMSHYVQTVNGIYGPFVTLDKSDAKLTATVVLLTSSGWTEDNTIDIPLAGITSDDIVWISPRPDSIDGYTDSGIIAVSQGTGKITLQCDNVPSDNIAINVLYSTGTDLNIATDISNDEQVAINADNIAQNTADITQNTTDIATNASAISHNASDISQNALGIAQNASDIANIAISGGAVPQASNTVLGVVKGSAEDGKCSVNASDGTLFLNGYSDIITALDSGGSASGGLSRTFTELDGITDVQGLHDSISNMTPGDILLINSMDLEGDLPDVSHAFMVCVQGTTTGSQRIFHGTGGAGSSSLYNITITKVDFGSGEIYYNLGVNGTSTLDYGTHDNQDAITVSGAYKIVYTTN